MHNLIPRPSPPKHTHTRPFRGRPLENCNVLSLVWRCIAMPLLYQTRTQFTVDCWIDPRCARKSCQNWSRITTTTMALSYSSTGDSHDENSFTSTRFWKQHWPWYCRPVGLQHELPMPYQLIQQKSLPGGFKQQKILDLWSIHEVATKSPCTEPTIIFSWRCFPFVCVQYGALIYS